MKYGTGICNHWTYCDDCDICCSVEAQLAERAAIVAWLYLQPSNECQEAAVRINDGEHLKNRAGST